jgi:hypothetical protein
MGTFLQAIAVGFVGAITVGFAYWGILVLIRPGLDRLRTLVHGKQLAGHPYATIPVRDKISASPIPRIAIPHEYPTKMPVLVGRFHTASHLNANPGSLELLSTKMGWPESRGIFYFAGHGPANMSVPNSAGIMHLLEGGPNALKPLGEPLYVDPTACQTPPWQSVYEAAWTKPVTACFFDLDSGMYFGMKAEIKQAAACVQSAEMPTSQKLPAMFVTPDETSMSKLRMAKFSPPPGVLTTLMGH